MSNMNNKNLEQQVSNIFDSITVFPTDHFQTYDEVLELTHKQFISTLTFLLEDYEKFITVGDKEKLLQAFKSYNRLLAYLLVLNILKRSTEALIETQGLDGDFEDYHTSELMDHSGYNIIDFDHENTEELEQYLSEFG